MRSLSTVWINLCLPFIPNVVLVGKNLQSLNITKCKISKSTHKKVRLLFNVSRRMLCSYEYVGERLHTLVYFGTPSIVAWRDLNCAKPAIKPGHVVCGFSWIKDRNNLIALYDKQGVLKDDFFYLDLHDKRITTCIDTICSSLRCLSYWNYPNIADTV